MKKLPTKFILTALAFTGGILLTRYLRKKREDKNTGVETSKTTIGDPRSRLFYNGVIGK